MSDSTGKSARLDDERTKSNPLEDDRASSAVDENSSGAETISPWTIPVGVCSFISSIAGIATEGVGTWVEGFVLDSAEV